MVLCVMSDLLPVKAERRFLVGPGGETSLQKKRDKLTPPVSSTPRIYLVHTAARVAIAALSRFMEQYGFMSNMGDSNQRISFEKSGFLVDVSIRDMRNSGSRIAYITSGQGYDPFSPRRVIGEDIYGAKVYGVNAKVVMQSRLITTRYAIMVNLSHPETGSLAPVMIELPEELAKPSQYVYKNVLGVIAAMCEKVPKVKDLFQKEKILAEGDRQIDDPAINA